MDAEVGAGVEAGDGVLDLEEEALADDGRAPPEVPTCTWVLLLVLALLRLGTEVS